MLDDQAKQGTVVLEAQTKHQKDYLKTQAEQQKKQFIMQVSEIQYFAALHAGGFSKRARIDQTKLDRYGSQAARNGS